jgi:nicotinamide-nucleotide amidase
MNAEILTIGDEILIGQVINTNSVWLAQELTLAGIKVVHMASISDEEQAIVRAFEQAGERADLVFITGGLGPTKDDVTKKAFAGYFGAELVMDEEVLSTVESYFTRLGKQIKEMHRRQALVPQGCTVIRNSNGTAPGMWMKKNKTVYISMPGVPYEMKGMMLDSILPKIKQEYSLPDIYHKSVLTQGIGETTIASRVEAWEDALAGKSISLAYLPEPGSVRLRLSAHGAPAETLKNKVAAEIRQLDSLIGEYIYGYETYGEPRPSLASIVSQLLRERGQTLALAESCTGGYIASLFTAIPGASEVFRGAIVPYTNTAKHELLQVDKDLFSSVGAVSQEVVEQLAREVRTRLHSDYAISVSGIAGPTGGTPGKPVGTVWIAVAGPGRVLALKFQFGDDRQRNITMTAASAINLLRKFILNLV